MTATLQHFARLKARHGVAVEICRDSGASCRLIAVPAKSTAKLVGTDGSYNEITIDDWLIAVGDWTMGNGDGVVIPGITEYPLKGDCINVTGLQYVRYWVGHPDDKTPVYANFNQLDRPPLVWRVHSLPG
ncbi:MAG: hypothetical protein JSS49_27480 [Planctomycetes bacterium]|nr:hypothetical protein [Planctomycetota bacterium]